jgi:hypothetical protein
MEEATASLPSIIQDLLATKPTAAPAAPAASAASASKRPAESVLAEAKRPRAEEWLGRQLPAIPMPFFLDFQPWLPWFCQKLRLSNTSHRRISILFPAELIIIRY